MRGLSSNGRGGGEPTAPLQNQPSWLRRTGEHQPALYSGGGQWRGAVAYRDRLVTSLIRLEPHTRRLKAAPAGTAELAAGSNSAQMVLQLWWGWIPQANGMEVVTTNVTRGRLGEGVAVAGGWVQGGEPDLSAPVGLPICQPAVQHWC